MIAAPAPARPPSEEGVVAARLSLRKSVSADLSLSTASSPTSHSTWSACSDEDIFWQSYCELESNKHDTLHSVPLSLISFFFRNVETQSEPFRAFFIERSAGIACFLLSVSAITLLWLMVRFNSYNGINDLRATSWSFAWTARTSSWIFVNAICVGYYVLHFFKPTGFMEQSVSILTKLGFALVVYHVLVLVTALMQLRPGQMCIDRLVLGADINLDSHISITNIFIGCLYMSFLALMPFPRIHIMRLASIEIVEQITRLLGCCDFSGLQGGSFFWAASIGIAIVFFLLISSIISAFTFELSAKASYEHTQRLKRAAQEKTILVNKLCTDLKIPAQQTRRRWKEARLDRELRAMALIVDNILFLLRVHERRFTFSLATMELLDLPALVEDIVQTLWVCRSGTGLATRLTIDDALEVNQHASLASVASLACRSNKLAVIALLFYSFKATMTRRDFPYRTRRKSGRNGSWLGSKWKIGLGIELQRSKPRNGALAGERSGRLVFTVAARRVSKAPPGHAQTQAPAASAASDASDSIIVDATPPSTSHSGQGRGSGVRSGLTAANSFRDARLAYRSVHRDTATAAVAAAAAAAVPVDAQEALHEYQSCLMFCKQVAVACQGSFSHSSAHGVMRFDIPCEIAAMNLWPNDAPGDMIDPAGIAESRDGGGGDLSAQSTLGMSELHMMCIYSTDPALSELALQAVRSVAPYARDGDVSVFSHLNMADMHVHSIVIVTSLQACQELKSKRYVGLLILMSDRLAYLDDRDRMLFDYVLSIPATRLQVQELARWVLAALSGKGSAGGVVAKLRPIAALSVAPKSCPWQWRLLPPIPASAQLNLFRWKILNPTWAVTHRTNVIEVTWALAIIATIAPSFIFVKTRYAGLSAILPFFLLVSFRWGQRYLPHAACHRALRILFLLLCLLSYFTLYQRFSGFRHGHYLQWVDTSELRQSGNILEDDLSGISGEQTIFSLATALPQAKIIAELAPWPFNLVLVLSSYLQAGATLWIFLARVYDRTMVQFFFFFLTLGYVALGVVIIYVEALRRTEFMEMREFVLSRDFLERSIAACWRDSLSPLSALTARQELLQDRLSAEAMQRFQSSGRLPVWSARHDSEKLAQSIVLSRELLYEMQISLQAARARNVVALVQGMEVVMVRPIVRKVCSLFLTESDALTVRFHLSIHPSLLLLRCDRAMLEAVTSHACRNAVERIQRSIKLSRQQHLRQQNQQTHAAGASSGSGSTATGGGIFVRRSEAFKHNGGLEHDVLVSLVPAPGDETLRFSDLHTLLVTVFDTALRVYDAHGVAVWVGTGQRTSQGGAVAGGSAFERFLMQHGQRAGRFELQLLRDRGQMEYTHREVLSVPYKLCPATPKVAQHCGQCRPAPEAVVPGHWRFLDLLESELLADRSDAPPPSFRPSRAWALGGPITGAAVGGVGGLGPSSSTAASAITVESPLCILCADTREGTYRASEIASISDCCHSGWERSVLYLKPGQMPDADTVHELGCIVVDHELVARHAGRGGNEEASEAERQQFLQTLLLVLRVNDMVGLIVLLKAPGATVVEAQGETLGDERRRVPLGSTSASLNVSDGIRPDVEVSSLDRRTLLWLRSQWRERLQTLAFVS